VHVYSTDSNERRNVLIVLFALSAGGAYLIHVIVDAVATPPWWIEIPSVLGSFALLEQLFERVVWRAKWLQRIGLVRVPDLNGVWHGVVSPASADERNEERDAEVTIEQTWTRISIALETGLSRSTSTTAMLLTEGPNAPAISYEFFNEPRAGAPETMHPHRGNAHLRLIVDSNAQHLKGEYYSGRGRQGYGSMRLRRQ
jgi:hypothetical protein